MRSCTTHAIRMRHGYPEVAEERCIDCGECIRICGRKAIRPRSEEFVDLAGYDHLIAIPSSPLLVQFQRDVGPSDIISALKSLDFDEVVTVDEASGIYTVALAKLLLSGQGKRPLLTTHCPVITRMVQTLYPDLTEHLVPLRSPRELTARLARGRAVERTGLPPERIGVVYITPCPAKTMALEDTRRPTESNIDAVIAVSEIYHSILTQLDTRTGTNDADPEGGGFVLSLGHSFLGGLSRNQRRFTGALVRRPEHRKTEGHPVDYLPVAQIGRIRRIFESMEKGRLDNVDLLECMACPEGCVGGSLVVDNPYLARSKAIRLLRAAPPPEDLLDVDVTMKRIGLVEVAPEDRHQPIPAIPLDPDLQRSLGKMQRKEELIRALPGINCGACGAPTCAELADDIVRDQAEFGNCIVLRAGVPQDAPWRKRRREG